MQSVLPTWQRTDPVELYWKLKDMGKLDTQAGRILQILIDNKAHPAYELSRISLQYNARIYELRQLGVRIDNFTNQENNTTYFQLSK